MKTDTILELQKVAQDAQQRAGWKKHLGNALLIGAGTGLGAGAGTLAANLIGEKVPGILRSKYLPLALGGSAALVNYLYNMQEEEKERRLQPKQIGGGE